MLTAYVRSRVPATVEFSLACLHSPLNMSDQGVIMEDRNRMTNEGGGQTQGGKPNPGGQPGGRPQDGKPNSGNDDDDRGRQDQGGKGGARPSPSGVPNEG